MSVTWPSTRDLPPTTCSYIIPTPVVRHFLCEVARYGQYRGYCSLGVLCQNLENPHLRRALGMAPHMSGVLVNNVQQTSSAAKVGQSVDMKQEIVVSPSVGVLVSFDYTLWHWAGAGMEACCRECVLWQRAWHTTEHLVVAVCRIPPAVCMEPAWITLDCCVCAMEHAFPICTA